MANVRRPLVAMVVYPDFTLTDLAGPADVLNSSGQYEVEVVAKAAGPVRAASWDPGISVNASRSLSEVAADEVDTLVVVGGWGMLDAARDGEMLEELQRVAAGCRRVTSVCTGAFVLAAAGLLDGRRATTHWQFASQLAEMFPAIDVDTDAIFVRDGACWTSAGVTAGIDLALALVEDDYGHELALSIARLMVVFMQRAGGQSQFSAQLVMQAAGRQPIRELQHWILDNLTEDLSVERLAERVAMSPRHFSRVFKREAGSSPGDYVESVRVDAARRMLESTDLALKTIARECGFGTVETFHRSVKRVLGVTPGEYRDRFAPAIRAKAPPLRLEHEPITGADAATRAAG
ncbi:MAG TPA: GlxA family transcriptional regulator [Acidimicrobiales bacterium]|nr:GlxA family transcriptional regulator [Acidimicrobiales bacterium]